MEKELTKILSSSKNISQSPYPPTNNFLKKILPYILAFQVIQNIPGAGQKVAKSPQKLIGGRGALKEIGPAHPKAMSNPQQKVFDRVVDTYLKSNNENKSLIKAQLKQISAFAHNEQLGKKVWEPLEPMEPPTPTKMKSSPKKKTKTKTPTKTISKFRSPKSLTIRPKKIVVPIERISLHQDFGNGPSQTIRPAFYDNRRVVKKRTLPSLPKGKLRIVLNKFDDLSIEEKQALKGELIKPKRISKKKTKNKTINLRRDKTYYKPKIITKKYTYKPINLTQNQIRALKGELKALKPKRKPISRVNLKLDYVEKISPKQIHKIQVFNQQTVAQHLKISKEDTLALKGELSVIPRKKAIKLKLLEVLSKKYNIIPKSNNFKTNLNNLLKQAFQSSNEIYHKVGVKVLTIDPPKIKSTNFINQSFKALNTFVNGVKDLEIDKKTQQEFQHGLFMTMAATAFLSYKHLAAFGKVLK